MNANGDEVKRLTNSSSMDYSPGWSDDGQQVVFNSNRNVNMDIIIMERDAYIALDESYIIFSSMLPGGRCDNLHISFKITDGNWTRPQFMAGINSEYSDNRPYVTPDGKYLFFYSGRTGNGDIYWVDAEVIEKFRASSDEGGIR